MKYEVRRATHSSCHLIRACVERVKRNERTTFKVERATNPRQPTSNGHTVSDQFWARAAGVRSAYLSNFRSCDTRMRSSFGHVSSRHRAQRFRRESAEHPVA